MKGLSIPRLCNRKVRLRQPMALLLSLSILSTGGVKAAGCDQGCGPRLRLIHVPSGLGTDGPFFDDPDLTADGARTAKEKAEEQADLRLTEPDTYSALAEELGQGVWQVTFQKATMDIDPNQPPPKNSSSCDPVNGKPPHGSPSNDLGEPDEEEPMVDPPCNCHEFGPPNTVQQPPYEYRLDIGVGYSPTTGDPMGRIRFIYDFEKDGTLANGILPRFFKWDGFINPSNDSIVQSEDPINHRKILLWSGAFVTINTQTAWIEKIETPAQLPTPEGASMIQFNLNKDAGGKVTAVTVFCYRYKNSTPNLVRTLKFEKFTGLAGTAPNQMQGTGVKISDFQNNSQARTGYVVGVKAGNGADWISIALDGTQTLGRKNQLGGAGFNQWQTTLTRTEPTSRGGRITTTTRTFKPGSDSLVEKEAVKSGLEERVTSYTYHSTAGKLYNKVRSITRPDGSWVSYEDYDAQGQPIRTLSPWKDSPLTTDPQLCVEETVQKTKDSSWFPTPQEAGPTGLIIPELYTEIRTTNTLGKTTSQSTTNVSVMRAQDLLGSIYNHNANNRAGNLNETSFCVLRSQTNTDIVSGQRTGNWTFAALLQDGNEAENTSFMGSISTSDGELVFREYLRLDGGFNQSLQDAYPSAHTCYRETYRDVNLDSDVPSIASTGRQEIVYVWEDEMGNTLARKTTRNGVQIDLVESLYDGHTLTKETHNGLIKFQEVSSSFTQTNTSRTFVNHLGQQIKQVWDPVTNELLRTETLFKNDTAANTVTTSSITNPTTRIRTDTESVGIPGGTVTLKRVITTQLDAWDRPFIVTAPNGAVTTYTYTDGGRTITAMSPGGTTTVTSLYLDGRLKSITGNGQIGEFHDYTIEDSGALKQTIRTGSATSPRIRTSTTDSLGRIIQETWPSSPQAGDGLSDFLVKSTSYDLQSRPIRINQTGLATQLYQYSRTSNSNTVIEALDLADGGGLQGNGEIDANGPDLVTEKITTHGVTNSKPWSLVTTKVYGAGPTGEPRTTAVRTWLGDEVTRTTETTQPDGTINTLTTAITSPSGSTKGKITITESRKISGATSPTVVRTSVYQGDLLISQITAPSTTAVVFTYDGLGRLTKQAGAGQFTQWTYDNSTTTKLTKDRLLSLRTSSTAGPLTTYTYETSATSPAFGKVKAVTLTPAVTTPATPGNVTYYAYNQRGEVTYQWGSGGPPLAYGYDETTGEMVSLKTYQNTMAQWSSATFPSIWESAPSSLTQWSYDQASGSLISKTDAAGRTTSYRYDSAGRIAQRTWARGVVTTYGYDSAGRWNSTTYSDGTPPVTAKYSRAGDIIEWADASGTHTVSRSGTAYLDATDAVTTGAGDWAGLTFERSRSSALAGGVGYWDEGLAIRFTAGNSIYNTSVRKQLNGVASSVTALGITTTFARNPNGWPAGHSMAAVSGSTYPVMTAVANLTRSLGYDAQGRLSSVSYAATGDTAAKSSWTYGFDGANRRQTITPGRTGTTGWKFGYTPDGSVSSADRRSGTTTVASQHWEYAYDAIGNRTASIKGAALTAATAAQRRVDYAPPVAPRDGTQYGSVTHAGSTGTQIMDLSGVVTPTAAVTVTLNGQAASTTTATSTTGETGTYYREFPLSTSTLGASPAWLRMVAAVGTGAARATTDGWVLYRGTQEVLSHDLDGNLTSDARWTYTWDAENRLTSMEEKVIPAIGVGTPPLRTRLVFRYDGYGRRTSKQVFRWDGASWQISRQITFLYDGWNIVTELDALNTGRALRKYAWGPDLSGTMRGAGGVGGLLMVENMIDAWVNNTATGTVTVGTRYLTQSDGNGNVMGLLAIDGPKKGVLRGRLDYDAFGNPVTNTTPAGLEACPIGFSSKYLDAETGLVYYGFRYYSPELGRWLNRDPVEERGGLNVFAISANDAVNYFDSDGREPLPRRAPSRPTPKTPIPTVPGEPFRPPSFRPEPPVYDPFGIIPEFYDFNPQRLPQPPPDPFSYPIGDPRGFGEPKHPKTEPVDEEGWSALHAGRWHVQFGKDPKKTKKHYEVIWRRIRAPGWLEGQAMINKVKSKAPMEAQNELRGEFEKAAKFIQGSGGLREFFPKSWPGTQTGKPRCWHLDLEVQKGQAFGQMLSYDPK